MKNIGTKIFTLCLTAMISACSFSTTHNHVYVQHRGFVDALKDEGLTEYYTCSRCGTYFNKNKEELKTKDGVRINKYRGNLVRKISVIGKDVEIFYSEDFVKKVDDTYKELIDGVKNETLSFNRLVTLNNTLFDCYKTLYDDNYNMYIFADFYYNFEYSDLLNEIENYLTKIYLYFTNLYREIADSKYKRDYFGDMSDEEIANYIGTNTSEKTEKLTEYRNKMNAAVKKYNQDEDVDVAECFKEYKKYANLYAQLLGYDDYVDYSYKVAYSRDYTIEDVRSIKGYMKDYIYSTRETLSSQIKNTYQTMNERQKTEYNDLSNYLINNFDCIESYVNDFMGGNLSNSYKHLLESGNYFLSDVSNPTTTAYCGTYYNGEGALFFSADYQDTKTFIHEFGHYNSGIYSSSSSYDICETQSQGNEALFYYYINNYSQFDSKVKEVYIGNNISSFLWSIYGTFAVTLVEDYAYTHDDFTTEDLHNVWENYFVELGDEKYGSSSNDYYWEYYLFNSPLYAISYSTSAIGALEIYALANQDINKAKDSYEKISTLDGSKYSFQSGYEYAGLTNIFEKETFEAIKNSIIKE